MSRARDDRRKWLNTIQVAIAAGVQHPSASDYIALSDGGGVDLRLFHRWERALVTLRVPYRTTVLYDHLWSAAEVRRRASEIGAVLRLLDTP